MKFYGEALFKKKLVINYKKVVILQKVRKLQQLQKSCKETFINFVTSKQF